MRPKQLAVLWVGPIALIAGVAIGMLARSSVGVPDESPAAVSEAEGSDEHDDHVDVSPEAARSMGLVLGPVETGPYRQWLHVPAIVIEKPGQSGLSVTAPMQGIVRRVDRFPGQSLSPGDPLFTIQVADEALESAQLSLLDILTRITVSERELQRLEPLAETGAIVGRRKIEVEYQLKQLNSERAARLQELRLRGLTSEQIDRIVVDRELVNEVQVRLDVSDDLPGEASDREPIYTVEQLNAFPGLAVRKGDELAHVANHHELFLRGDAFESDIAVIREVVREGTPVAAEFGEGEARRRLDDLQVIYLDNHVDRTTQTFPFYILLPNTVVAERRDHRGRLFHSWQFKPGQRCHVYVPTDEIDDGIVVPREAVYRRGAEAWVFRLEDPPPSVVLDDAGKMKEPAFAGIDEIELEPVRVQVLKTDRHRCVLARGGGLLEGDTIALNRAYQLYLAWRLQFSGGGHHDHDH